MPISLQEVVLQHTHNNEICRVSLSVSKTQFWWNSETSFHCFDNRQVMMLHCSRKLAHILEQWDYQNNASNRSIYSPKYWAMKHRERMLSNTPSWQKNFREISTINSTFNVHSHSDFVSLSLITRWFLTTMTKSNYCSRSRRHRSFPVASLGDDAGYH